MAKLTKKSAKKAAKRAKTATRDAYDTVETKVMAAVGRNTVKRKVKGAKAVATRAGKSALIAGTLAAAGVVVSEISKRRNPA